MNSSEGQATGLAQTIEQAKRQLERMIDLYPGMMMLVDRAGNVARTNKATLAMLDRPDFQSVLDCPIERLFPCSNPSFFRDLMRTRSGHAAQEARIALPGRGERLLRFTIVGAGPDSDMFAVMVDDATDERAQAARLEKEHKKKATREVVGALLHNINQPLTVILARSQLMRLAVERGTARPEDLNQVLADIAGLTLQIADTLTKAGRPRDYVTEEYEGGVEILDIERSLGARAPEHAEPYAAAFEALLPAMDIREPGFWLHARRTAEFASILAARMGSDEREVRAARLGGLFHDMGKLGIPDAILRKPTPLSPAETETMRKHTEIGNRILRNFLPTEAAVAHAHHERIDGTGYPLGLRGPDIPVCARIVAVADAFDAMRSRRPYHDSACLEEVTKEILSASGTQFDRDAVAAFRQCRGELDASFRRSSGN